MNICRCKKLIRLIKWTIILHLCSHFSEVSCQISLNPSKEEIDRKLAEAQKQQNAQENPVGNVICHSGKQTREANRDKNCKKLKKPRRPRRQDVASTDVLYNQELRARKCRCRKKDKTRRRAMLDDHSSVLGGIDTAREPRPKIKMCSNERCLTFTNGRKAFSTQEYTIVSNTTFVEVIEGAWEFCGEFMKAISCGVMGYDSYIDLFDGEFIRVTTFKKVGLPDEIPDYQINEDLTRNVLDKVTDMADELTELTDNVDAMEQALDKSTKLLLYDRYKNSKKRKKLRRLLDDP